ncbi:NAD(P)-binding protein [Auriscalpium vulgare]|uniref:NAD(P)-binding protein n=1 Tax=Auriscalpium vulgare TaxID=40419 RepID=A0ACB8RC64_9AGAM|nr:NAD(P)-binding protein [Auriscalpium vulgare]
MSSVPSTQRAWRVVTRGPPSKALKFVTDLPVPTKLESGHVLVKVEAAALNPIGYKLMKWLPNFVARRPITAEQDLAGTVVDGNGTRWKAGDAVWGITLGKPHGEGAMSEYAVLPQHCLAGRPPNVTPTQAAGIATTALTAYEALFDSAHLKEGQTVFINGGSTAVGAYAIQLAKARGLRVVATASERNREFVTKMGADEFIDYTKVDLAAHLSSNPPSPKFDGVLEAVGLIGNDLYAQSEKYLAPGGVFVSVGPQPEGLSDAGKFTKLLYNISAPRWFGGINRKWSVLAFSPREEVMTDLHNLFAEGKVKPIIDSVYAFEDALKAYDRIMTKRATGKVIVKVDPNVE